MRQKDHKFLTKICAFQVRVLTFLFGFDSQRRMDWVVSFLAKDIVVLLY
jgi:hypothetical protein